MTGPLHASDAVIDCGNSGTSLRLLAGAAAGLDGRTVLTGDASLLRRPVDRVAAPLRAMGADVWVTDGRWPPLSVRGGRLHGVTHRSPVASAQVKSAVLIAGLSADGAVEVRSPLPSRDHTERMLGHLGVTVDSEVTPGGAERVRLEPARPTARAVSVPGDPSSAAFWLVAAASQPVGDGEGRVTIDEVCLNPGRLGMVEVLLAFGADVTVEQTAERAGEAIGGIQVTTVGLSGHADVAGSATVRAIDELPILALAGALSDGGLVVHDAGELRVKESDRIDRLAAVLAGVGLRVDAKADGFRVPGGQRPGPGQVDAAGDHRLAMTACIAATVGTGPVEVAGFEVVATSYPGFLDDLVALGGNVEVLG